MFIWDNDAIHYYTDLEKYETLLFVLRTLGPETRVLNYMYGTISQTEVVDKFFPGSHETKTIYNKFVIIEAL